MKVLLLLSVYFCLSTASDSMSNCSCGRSDTERKPRAREFVLRGSPRWVIWNPTKKYGDIKSLRIVGGIETPTKKYTWNVSILREGTRKYTHHCGGSIITEWHVLTAAHCFEDTDHWNLKLLVGYYNIKGHHFLRILHDHDPDEYHSKREPLDVEAVISHEDYKDMFRDDIALVVAAEKFKLGPTLVPVCLPVEKPDLANQYVIVTGWGDTTNGKPSNVLLETELMVVSLEDCKEDWIDYDVDIETTHFCTHGEGKDMCQGDSGGPVVWLNPENNRFTLVALVSYGLDCPGDIPGVNTDVYSYMDWIKKHVAESKPDAEICTGV